MFGIKKLRKELEELKNRHKKLKDDIWGLNGLQDSIRDNQIEILDLKKEKEHEDREEAKKIALNLYNKIDERVLEAHDHINFVKLCSIEFFDFLSKNKNADHYTPEFLDKVLEEIKKL